MMLILTLAFYYTKTKEFREWVQCFKKKHKLIRLYQNHFVHLQRI